MNFPLQITAGQAFVFSVYVIDNLGERSEVKSMRVSRTVENQPLMIEITRQVSDWDPQRIFRMRAIVSKSECIDVDIEKLMVSAISHSACRFQCLC